MQMLRQGRFRELERELGLLRKAVGELKLLNELALATSGSLTVDEKLNVVLEKSLSAVDAEQASILLSTGDTGTPFTTLIRQDDRSSLRRSYHLGSHISGYVLYHRKPLLIDDLAKDGRFEPSQEERADIKSVLCVPMMHENILVGVLTMTNKKRGGVFNEDDQRLLMILAAQSCQLIINGRLQEETQQKERQLVIARVESERLLALDRWKSEFYENISHEFRTPLTLILAPLAHLISEAATPAIKSEYLVMRRNAQRLLRLINEMLDMSRIEAGSMRLTVTPGDLAGCIAGIVEVFRPAAIQVGVSLSFSGPAESREAFFDADALEKILSNLLSNALKFTPVQGEVLVTLDWTGLPDQREMILVVSDTGDGIPPEDIGHIFDRYYRVQIDAARQSTGSGIGLALTKQLVELHHGSISIESAPGRGAQFVVRMPVEKTRYSDLEMHNGHQQENPREREAAVIAAEELAQVDHIERRTAPGEREAKLPIMLVVEDDPELRRYMHHTLETDFRVIGASDGQQGFALAVETLPDIVVSDVVMPGMDGIELCRMLKNDERTSHIPVLLLTARPSQEMKITGLETGADDYLVKPFEWGEFCSRVRNLVEGRQRLRRRFSRMTALKPSEIAVSSMDELFLKKAIVAVERSMGDENFIVEDLAVSIGMSYGQIHRKLVALAGQTPAQFIRSLRLHRAMEMIRKNAGTISEIAYTVGFGSPAYFTRCFHEQFGMAPSEARAIAVQQPALSHPIEE